MSIVTPPPPPTTWASSTSVSSCSSVWTGASSCCMVPGVVISCVMVNLLPRCLARGLTGHGNRDDGAAAPPDHEGQLVLGQFVGREVDAHRRGRALVWPG